MTLVESNHFRSAPDGTRVFFPWRPAGQGYVIPSPEAERGLERVLTTLYLALFVCTAAGYAWASSGSADPTAQPFLLLLRTAVCAVLPLPFYALWLARVLPGFPPSDFRVSSEQIRAEAISRMGPNDARNGGLASLAVGFGGLVLAWGEPSQRAFGLFCAAVFFALGIFGLRMHAEKKKTDAGR